jgi:hypothetical protein
MVNFANPILCLTMPPKKHRSDDTELRSEVVAAWLQFEIDSVTKAVELRLKHAKEIAAEFAAGKISSKEVDEKIYDHETLWGEALPGAHPYGMSDDQILSAIENVRVEQGVRSRRIKDVKGTGPRSR